MNAAHRMRVEIWSDVICPFCYIGKRRLENALTRLPQPERVEIVWRSFQLQPDARTDPARNAVEHLAMKKGWTLEFTRLAIADVTNRARQAGLDLQLEKTVIANTFDARRLAHYAAARGQGEAMQERLFRAYFVEGVNVADHAALAALAAGIGLPAQEVHEVLGQGRFAAEVRRDLEEAARLGINGVPFFVFDKKYAVSGAQDSAVFLGALQQSLAQWSGAQSAPAAHTRAGPVCTPEGRCD